VLAKSRPLILDPLLGHPEASRHVTNLNLRGTTVARMETRPLAGLTIDSHGISTAPLTVVEPVPEWLSNWARPAAHGTFRQSISMV
jgi:hypothetical protein